MASKHASLRSTIATVLCSDRHHLVRLEAARSLRGLQIKAGDPGFYEINSAFLKAIGDTEDGVCIEAMRFAIDNPGKEYTSPILAYLDRKGAKHQCKAIEVLGFIQDPAAAPRLLELLADENAAPEVRSRACGVLALMKNDAAEPVIRRIAGQKSGSQLSAVAQECLKLYGEGINKE